MSPVVIHFGSAMPGIAADSSDYGPDRFGLMGVGGRHYIGDLLVLKPDSLVWSSGEHVIAGSGRGTHWNSSDTEFSISLSSAEYSQSYFDIIDATSFRWHIWLANIGGTLTVSDGRLQDDLVVTT